MEIETDASNLNSALTSSSFDMAVNAIIFRDIKCLLYSEFVSAKVLYIPMSCNIIADALAKLGAYLGLGSGAVELWSDCNPAAVNDLVATDQVLTSV